MINISPVHVASCKRAIRLRPWGRRDSRHPTRTDAPLHTEGSSRVSAKP